MGSSAAPPTVAEDRVATRWKASARSASWLRASSPLMSCLTLESRTAKLCCRANAARGTSLYILPHAGAGTGGRWKVSRRGRLDVATAWTMRPNAHNLALLPCTSASCQPIYGCNCGASEERSSAVGPSEPPARSRMPSQPVQLNVTTMRPSSRTSTSTPFAAWSPLPLSGLPLSGFPVVSPARSIMIATGAALLREAHAPLMTHSSHRVRVSR